MTLVMNQMLDAQLSKPEAEEKQTEEPEETTNETTMVLWDWVPTLGADEEESTEEVQISSINVTTRSKGPIVDRSIVLPKIHKVKESLKKILSTTQTPPKFNLENTKDTDPVVNQLAKVGMNKT